MQLNLKDKVALVTGGARGIGRAIATSLATSGATVIVNYKGNQAAADEVVQAIAADDGQALAIQADISQSAEVDRLFKAVIERYSKIDILVNNAGITRDTLLLRMKEDDFNAVIDTNLGGVFLCTKAALRPMTKARSGRIINITSVVGLIGNAGQSNYAAAKAGLIGFSKSVALENANKGVTCNVIAPGYIRTDMVAAMPEAVLQKIVAQIPVGRLGESEDIARCVVFLASDEASFITGSTLTANGGQYLA